MSRPSPLPNTRPTLEKQMAGLAVLDSQKGQVPGNFILAVSNGTSVLLGNNLGVPGHWEFPRIAISNPGEGFPPVGMDPSDLKPYLERRLWRALGTLLVPKLAESDIAAVHGLGMSKRYGSNEEIIYDQVIGFQTSPQVDLGERASAETEEYLAVRAFGLTSDTGEQSEAQRYITARSSRLWSDAELKILNNLVAAMDSQAAAA